MRALLIVNPHATSSHDKDVTRVADELAPAFDLVTAETRYPSHASELAADAAAEGFDLVIPFGGDGTLNEAVNGLMHATVRSRPDARARGVGSATVGAPSAPGEIRGPSRSGGLGGPGGPGGLGGLGMPGGPGANGDGGAAAAGNTAPQPAIAPIPVGGANVFAQSFGFPPDPAESARRVAAAAARAAGSGYAWRTIGLGLAGDRYFTFSAGIGLDAEVVADVARARARGRRATPGLYMRMGLRRYFLMTDRREPALTLFSETGDAVGELFMGIVTNSSPWTYLGRRPVSPVPRPDFSSGLDVFALRRLRTLTTLGALRQMLHTRDHPPEGRDVFTLDGLSEITFRSRRPIAFQADGEYLGEVTEMPFRYVPNALRVLSLRPPGSM